MAKWLQFLSWNYLFFHLVHGQERCLEKGLLIMSEINVTYNYISTAEFPCGFMYMFDLSNMNDTEIMVRFTRFVDYW